jgi:hypothetical protein
VEGRGSAGWLGRASTEGYLAELRAYDALLCQHANVVGATVFTMGQYASQWAPFDVGQLWPQVVAEMEPTVQSVHIPATFRTPVDGARISQPFGANPSFYAPLKGHPGVDLACPAGSTWREWHGTPVYATIAGECHALTDATYGLHCYTFGDYADELMGHLSGHAFTGHREVAVGDLLGWVGYTGRCVPVGGAGTHLHWGYRPKPYQYGNGTRGYIDPLGAGR